MGDAPWNRRCGDVAYLLFHWPGGRVHHHSDVAEDIVFPSRPKKGKFRTFQSKVSLNSRLTQILQMTQSRIIFCWLLRLPNVAMSKKSEDFSLFTCCYATLVTV